MRVKHVLQDGRLFLTNASVGIIRNDPALRNRRTIASSEHFRGKKKAKELTVSTVPRVGN